MPEKAYEVRGAHEDAIEERANHHEPLSQKIALFSAGDAWGDRQLPWRHTQNDALYYKNDAVLMKARASDSWAYYQSEDIKRHLADTVAALAPASASADAADSEKYAARARCARRRRIMIANRRRPTRNRGAHCLRTPSWRSR